MPQERFWRVLIFALTVVRVPLALAAALLLLIGDRTPVTLWLAVGAILLCDVSDVLDGALARRRGLVSEWGAMLDPLADSVSRLIVYWALAVSGLVLPFVPLVMAVRDIVVAYSRIAITRSGRSVAAKFSGKLKACVQAIGAPFAVLASLYVAGNWPVHVVSWVVAGITAASAIQYVMAALSAARTTDTQK